MYRCDHRKKGRGGVGVDPSCKHKQGATDRGEKSLHPLISVSIMSHCFAAIAALVPPNSWLWLQSWTKKAGRHFITRLIPAMKRRRWEVCSQWHNSKCIKHRGAQWKYLWKATRTEKPDLQTKSNIWWWNLVQMFCCWFLFQGNSKYYSHCTNKKGRFKYGISKLCKTVFFSSFALLYFYNCTFRKVE